MKRWWKSVPSVQAGNISPVSIRKRFCGYSLSSPSTCTSMKLNEKNRRIFHHSSLLLSYVPLIAFAPDGIYAVLYLCKGSRSFGAALVNNARYSSCTAYSSSITCAEWKKIIHFSHQLFSKRIFLERRATQPSPISTVSVQAHWAPHRPSHFIADTSFLFVVAAAVNVRSHCMSVS